jgi:hypothetical protein
MQRRSLLHSETKMSMPESCKEQSRGPLMSDYARRIQILRLVLTFVQHSGGWNKAFPHDGGTYDVEFDILKKDDHWIDQHLRIPREDTIVPIVVTDGRNTGLKIGSAPDIPDCIDGLGPVRCCCCFFAAYIGSVAPLHSAQFELMPSFILQVPQAPTSARSLLDALYCLAYAIFLLRNVCKWHRTSAFVLKNSSTMARGWCGVVPVLLSCAHPALLNTQNNLSTLFNGFNTLFRD